ncbi:MAG: hypothetical protein HUU49_03235 [Candidatus Buchananbacteria bacterium]|nr:hypothetical protein [Candidatus Buchananbacteria bacterium]
MQGVQSLQQLAKPENRKSSVEVMCDADDKLWKRHFQQYYRFIDRRAKQDDNC